MSNLLYNKNIRLNKREGVISMSNSNKIEERYARVDELLRSNQDDLKEVKLQISNLVKDIDNYQTKMDANEELSKVYDEVSKLYSAITKQRTGDIQSVLESVLNSALSRIPMDAEYEAVLEGPDYNKANPTVEIKLVDKNSGKTRTPLVSTGTMVAQLISFLMTAIVLKFSGARRIMVLDEVLSGFYDKDSIRLFGEILVALAKNEGFQFILVEHKSELAKVEGINIFSVDKPNYRQGLVLIDADEVVDSDEFVN